MYKFIVVLPIFAAACSDYNMVQKDEDTDVEMYVTPDSGEPVDTDVEDTGDSDVPVDTDEEAEEEPVDPKECNGFLINEGMGHYQATDTYAIFSLVGDSEIEVHQGETAKLPIAVTASNCGDLILTGFTVALSTLDHATPADWVTNVEHSGQAATVENTSGSAQFESNEGYNLFVDGAAFQHFYRWDSDVSSFGSQAEMDDVYVDAATTQIVEFSFTATEYVEPGTSFEMYLSDPFWMDVGTGAEAWDTYYYLPSFEDNAVRVTVTIVE